MAELKGDKSIRERFLNDCINLPYSGCQTNVEETIFTENSGFAEDMVGFVSNILFSFVMIKYFHLRAVWIKYMFLSLKKHCLQEIIKWK